jgi:hypothetical protein
MDRDNMDDGRQDEQDEQRQMQDMPEGEETLVECEC